MNTKAPQFLFFDLGRVLLNFDHEIAVRNLAELGECNVQPIRDVVLHSSLSAEYERGEISTSEFCERIRKQTRLKASDEQICHAASDIFWVNTPVIPIVAALGRSGRQLGILSNTCHAHWCHICDRNYGWMDLFDIHVLSFKVRAAKPDSRIYEEAARRVGFPPDAIFFVDDLLANVQGAIDAGLDAVQFTSARQLARDLRSRGLTFNY